jgi:glucosamine-6-phosphate deaminase
MNILIRKNYNDMSMTAAEIIARLVQTKPNCVLGLATGSTPIGTYQELIRYHQEEGLDFSHVTTFNLDEYLGLGMNLDLPYSLDQSYARFMYEELIKHINIKKENVHVPDGLAKDPEKFCQEYEAAIKDTGGIDLQLLGIGGDGHWAFNEPGSSLGSRTRVQALMKQTLDDNYASFYAKAGFKREDMPHFAITMGVGTILEARNILMIANGLKKADVVAQGIEGPITAQVTASAIQLHNGGITVVLDEEAASKLKYKDHYIHVEKMKKNFNL